MNEQELAYLAGIIDGEGSICIHKDSRDGRIWGEVTVYNTSQELISWIHERFGGNIYDCESRAEQYGTKRNLIIRWSGRDAAEFLPSLIPYLVIKKEKAKLLYDLTQVSKFSSNGQNRKEQETIYEMFKELGVVYALVGGS